LSRGRETENITLLEVINRGENIKENFLITLQPFTRTFNLFSASIITINPFPLGFSWGIHSH